LEPDGGACVAEAPSTQPQPKFGTVNALLGGVDHADAIDLIAREVAPFPLTADLRKRIRLVLRTP
jgi:hypothetical protein